VTPVAFVLVVLSEMCRVVGQIFFKHAMSGGRGKKGLWAGVAAMAVGFFLWLGLLKRFDLSFLYPFEGLNNVMVTCAATIFLKEKMTLSLWVGVTLICVGIVLVSRS
jgi:drug/metabolite transporter (DMT)-like permease